jgi:hypothetical protein
MAMFRKINTERYTGGRGTAAGHSRSEKRRGGRIRCSAMSCEFGLVADISASGVRVHCKKRPTAQVGESRDLTLTAGEESFTLQATCVWIRVDDRREFDMGWELGELSAATRKRLLELAATAQDCEGLSRGWSPMEWWRRAG